MSEQTGESMTKIKTTRWWLVRHAPVQNPERLVYGRSDMQLICLMKKNCVRWRGTCPAMRSG
jgi:hypothetical protein